MRALPKAIALAGLAMTAACAAAPPPMAAAPIGDDKPAAQRAAPAMASASAPAPIFAPPPPPAPAIPISAGPPVVVNEAFCVAFAEASLTTARARDAGMSMRALFDIAERSFDNPRMAWLMRDQIVRIYGQSFTPSRTYSIALGACRSVIGRDR